MNIIETQWYNDTTTSKSNMTNNSSDTKNHVWAASALAGGCSGALTWALIYPIDVIKTRIQTSSLDTPLQQRRMLHVGKHIVDTHGWKYLCRGLGVTLLRAFPVNGIIFPVYEFSLMQLTRYGIGVSSGDNHDDDKSLMDTS